MSWFVEIYFAIDNLLMQILKLVWSIVRLILMFVLVLMAAVVVMVFGLFTGKARSVWDMVGSSFRTFFTDTFKK